jgi:hypothetical protein
MLAIQHIRDTCIDFCGKTLIIQQTLDPLSMQLGVQEYTSYPPSGSVIQVITQAWYKRVPMAVMNGDSAALRPEMFNTLFENADLTPGTPTSLFCTPNGTITLNRFPQSADVDAITLRAALKPTRDSTSCNDLLFQEYAYEIGMGAAASVMLIPEQVFSSPSAAANARSVYIETRNKARIRANKAFGRSQARIQYRSF